MTYFIDTHAHLSDKAFDADRESAAGEAVGKGVERIFEILCSPSDWDKTGLFEKYEKNFYFAFGIHPEYAGQDKEENFLRLKELASGKRSLFIGETGFDYWWDNSRKKEQAGLLLRQLGLSSEISKPCVFHCRNGKDPKADNAYSDLLDSLEKNWKYESPGKKRGIMHSFSGSREDARRSLDLGLYLGINGTFTYPKNGELRDIVKEAGLENIVFETDCPYLPPQSMRGKRNSPARVIEVCGAVAGHFGETVLKTAERVYLNSLSFIK